MKGSPIIKRIHWSFQKNREVVQPPYFHGVYYL